MVEKWTLAARMMSRSLSAALSSPFSMASRIRFSISAAAARVKVAATTNSLSRSRWRRTSWVRRKVFPEPAEAVTKRLFTMGGLLSGRGPA